MFRRLDPDEDSPPQPDFLLGETAGGMGPIHEEDVPRSRSREPDDRGGARSWSERGQATASKPQTFDISSTIQVASPRCLP